MTFEERLAAARQQLYSSSWAPQPKPLPQMIDTGLNAPAAPAAPRAPAAPKAPGGGS